MIPLKNIRMLIIGLIAGALLATTATSFAADSNSKISAFLRDGFTFKVKGKTANLQHTPIVYQNTTYLPVRDLADMLGYDVGFADNTITLDQKTGDVGNVSTTTPPKTTTKIDIKSGNWVKLSDVTTKFNAVWAGEQGVLLTRDDGEQLKFLLSGQEKGEFTLDTTKGSVKGYETNGIIYLNADDLKAVGFFPQ